MILGIIATSVSLLSCACYGILSPVGLVCGIIAWVSASREKQRIAAGQAPPNGLNSAGYILGIIGTIVSLLVMLLGAIAIISIIIFAVNNPQPRNF